MSTENRECKTKKIVLPVIIAILVILPHLNMVFDIYSPGKLREKRRKIEAPVFNPGSPHKYLMNISKYYENRFDLRKVFVQINSIIKIKLFNVSPVDRVMLGKRGWLFIKKLKENEREVDYSVSVKMFSREELKYWARIFGDRRDWLNRHGIEMFIVIVPNKSTIYPEFLPDRIKKVTSQVRTDQLVNFFRNETEIKLLDLRRAIEKNKGKKLLYYKTDSHWNWYGAYIGYREIINFLSGSYPGVVAKRFDFFIRKRMAFPRGGDLASMLTLQNSLYRESFSRLFAGKMVSITRSKLPWFRKKNVNVRAYSSSHGVLPKTLMIHDSFGNRLRRMLSVHFKKIIYMKDWGFNFFPEVIKREKPKIVIYEIAERFLHNFDFHNPNEITGQKGETSKHY